MRATFWDSRPDSGRDAKGAVITSLLANIYLHCAFTLWMEAWREKVAHGDVIVVRHAPKEIGAVRAQLARTALCRECRATGIPTATPKPAAHQPTALPHPFQNGAHDSHHSR
jgi:hypothetical protein